MEADAQDRKRALNEAALRSANEGIERAVRAATPQGSSGPWLFACECYDPDCGASVELTIDEYDSVRNDASTFVIANGHPLGEADVVVQTDAYMVVRKLGTERDVAIATDPRRPDETPSIDPERARRIARNQSFYRDVNRRIERATPSLTRDDETIEIVCECGTIECAELIELTLGAYDEARRDDRQSIVKPGHEIGEVEYVVAEHLGYLVVRKYGVAADESRVLA